MEKSESISELAKALNKFQSKISQPLKSLSVKVMTKSGGQYSFKYADLSECIKVAKPILEETGLSVCQFCEDQKTLVTMLLHSDSGQYITSRMDMIGNLNDPQSFGSAMTYARRYQYCAMLGIVGNDDDDANYSCQNTIVEQKPKKAEVASDEELWDLIEKASTRSELSSIYKKYPYIKANTAMMDAIKAKVESYDGAKS